MHPFDESSNGITVTLIDSLLLVELSGQYGSLMFEKLSALAEQLRTLGTITNLRGMVMDFGDVTRIGASFLGNLVEAVNRMSPLGLPLMLCRLNSPCLSVVQLTGLDQLLPIYETPELARMAL